MARERYLLNAGEDTIHKNEIKPETPQQKRQNWWFYHKGHVVICVIAAAVLFSLIYTFVSRVDPDYTVAVMTSYSMPSVGVEELERCITSYADDRNGDGKVVVRVMDYTISSTAPTSSEAMQQQQAELTRFIGDCAANDSMIFLHDESAFTSLEENFEGFFQYNDGTPMPDGAEDYENAMRPWSDFAAFSEFVPETDEDETFTSEILTELFGKLRVSVRAAEGSSIEKKEKYMKYYEDSLALYSRLESGEIYTAGGE